MNPIESLHEGLQWANGLLEMVMADVTPDQLHWLPPGNAHPIGSTYAHGVIGEDMLVHNLLQGKTPLFMSSWSGQTGVSEPSFHQTLEWTRSVKIDLPQLRKYAQAVYAAAEAYIDSLSEQDLDRKIELSDSGLGEHTLNWCIQALIIAHLNNMSGEISAAKGMQGAQGYPF
ncbi:MAG TPA: DinB family protein [Anaerolineae bacterium]|nr:DinB family protein [Anaerolineae bacterium]